MRISGYKVERRIGEGGMASVHLAIQKSLDRPVALKVLNAVLTTDTKYSKRFVDEGRIIAALNHPNIITIYDVGVAQGIHYISMEYIQGGDLKNRMGQQLEPEAAIELVSTIARALDFAHAAGVIHRDVKPANILFRPDGTPLLTDFGIAKRLDSDPTVGMTVLGTPGYLSPEQAQGQTVDGRSDIYSLGVILHELLVGNRPFEADTEIATILKQLNEPVPDLPSALRRYQPLLHQMIATRPQDRFVDTAALLKFIEEHHLADPTWPARRSRRRSVAIGIGAGLSFAALGALVAGRDLDLPAVIPEFVASLAPAPPGSTPVVTRGPEPEATSASVPAATSASVPAATSASVPAATSASVPVATSASVPAATSAGVPVATSAGVPAATSASVPAATSASVPAATPKAKPETADSTPPKVTSRVPKKTRRASPAAAAAALSNSRVQRLLALGDEALAENRLAIPSRDSALAYFREALKLDPGNTTAKKGIAAVALRYAELVERDIRKRDFAAAKDRVALGLDAQPGNRRLRALSKSVAGHFAQVARLLASGERALKDYRLTTPPKDNALHYFDAVLALEPRNAQAKQGKARIAEGYARLAKDRIAKYQYDDAQELIRRGLRVQPGNRNLLALRGKAQYKNAPGQLVQDIKGIFN
jgi:serine/threonine-protein kinase PpkA